MKRLTQYCLIVMLALFGASTANAFQATMSSAYAGQSLSVGQFVDIQVHLDADAPGVTLLSLGFLFRTTDLVYVPRTNASVGVPAYILYGMSGGMPDMTTSLYAQQSSWLLWPGTKPVGMSQVNINWADTTFNGTYVTESNLKIADIRFQVLSVANPTSAITMTKTAGGNIFQVCGAVGFLCPGGNPDSPITLTGSPITLNLPEPTVGALAMTALVSLALVRRRVRKA